MEIPLADALSRVTPTPVEEDGIQLPIVAVNLITSNVPVSSTEIELIHSESSKDPTFTVLRYYINLGWPSECRKLPQELHTFWNYREDLSVEDGLITKGARLLIPSILRKRILEQIHEGHQGIEKCMLRAREAVFWPGISNDIHKIVPSIAKKLMEKAVKDGKPWNYGLMQYRTTPISANLPSPLEALTQRKPRSTLPQLPSAIGNNMETSKIHQELLRRQPSASRGSIMELEPGQPVFVKEVYGNVWKTGTIDQPASEPDSYWIRFPDNSILRRTRSMIKPRPLPSHFKLQAEAQPWNSEEKFSACSSDSLNLMNVESMLPVMPMGGVIPPATKDRDSKVRIPTNPIISTEAPQPSESGISPSVPATPRHSTHSTKGVPPVRFTPSKK